MSKLASLIILTILFLQGCAHQAPLQMGSGNYGDREVKQCTHVVLGFPVNSKDVRIDEIMKKYNIKSEGVYSIERQAWFYLFPFYGNHCTVITLNESKANSSIGSSTKGVRKSSDSSKEFDHLESVNQCNQYTSLTKGRCRKHFYNKQKS